jgi:hypothetical protein
MHAILLFVALALLLVGLAFATLLAGLVPFLLIFVIFGGGLALLAFWIWMLVDAIQNPGLGEGEKVCWVLAIVFLHVLAVILYFFIGRPKRTSPRLAMAGGAYAARSS